MFSDVIAAILPMLLIWRLSRPLIEKLLLSLLLGLVFVGVGAGIARILTLKSFNLESENLVGDMMPLYMWTRIEEIVIIIAACAPLLKVPIERVLHQWFGFPWFNPTTRDLRTVHTTSFFANAKRYFSWRKESGGSAEHQSL